MVSREDALLGRKISPPARDPEDNEGLRSLWIQRLTDGAKGIWRRSLKDDTKSSVYCEPCELWVRVKAFPIEWQCTECERYYRVEFAAYEEMVDDD